MSIHIRTAIGLAALVALIVSAAACGDSEDNATPVSTPTVTPSHTPGLSTETLLSEELNGVKVQLEYQPVAYVFATTPEEYRETKAALEKRLPSLVPDPCLVRWTAPVLEMILESNDYRTSGCH
jgi:nitrous oxide reductase accessory protein NosL